MNGGPENYQEYYLAIFDSIIENAEKKQERQELATYTIQLKQELLSLVEQITPETFWEIYPKVLGVDSKLQLLHFFTFQCGCCELTSRTILEMIEQDYRSYYQEMMDYREDKQLVTFLIYRVE